MPSKSLGTLTLDLIAKIGGYTGPLDKASRQTKKTSNNITKDLKRIGVAFAAVGGAAITATAALIKSQIDAADNLTKTSQAIGIEVEQLSALEFAAKLSGVEFASLTSGLGRFARVINDAYNGLATAKRSFDQLGISIKNSDGTLKSSEQLIDEIADRFAQMEDGVKKTAIAQELFGRSGAQLIPLLNQGADGIKTMTDEAERLGLVIDEKTGKAAEQFNDNLTRLRSVVTGTGRELTKELLPSMVEFTDLIADPQTQESIKAIVTGVADLAIGVIKAANAYIDLNKQLGEFIAKATGGVELGDQGELVKLQERRAALLKTIDRLASSRSQGYEDREVKAITRTVAALNAEIQKRQQYIKEYGATAEAQEKVAEVTKQVTEEVVAAVERAYSGEEILALAFNAGQISHEQYVRGINSLAGVEEITEALVPPDAPEVLYAKLFNAGELTYEQYVAGINAAAGNVSEGEAPFEEMSEFAKQAAGNIQDAFADFLYDPFEEGLKGMLHSFSNTLRRMAAEAASQAILKAIFGSAASSTNPYVAAFGAAFGGARAEGGPTQPGKAYLVGENGPEMWVPNAYGAVISNENMNGAGGAEPVVKQPIVAIGDDAVANALAGSSGEQVILTHVRNNWDGLTRGR